MNEEHEVLCGTIVWVAPFYNRSGYGVGARAAVSALHRAGVRIRVLSVNEVEAGIDDCDLALIKSLESTPLIPPITAIVSHVPNKIWLGIKLPEPNLRIIATTFDSSAQGNLPPAEWMAVFKEMDQVWLMTEEEREAFVSAGLPVEKIQVVYWPHPWLENPVVPLPAPETSAPEKPFRFLSIAMFLPRRRWNTLIEAYLEEFKRDRNVELYLKVNYPSWHPVPGKPRQDLHDLIRSLRQKTGSEAAIVIDEDLGTRIGIVHLIDSCNVYISTDTAPTTPISEARVRQRMVITPDGLGIGVPGLGIAVDPDAKFQPTPEMLLYQPHHKGAFMPNLHVKDVRSAMRRAFDISPEERQARAAGAACIPGPSEATPMAIKAINAGWEYKKSCREKASAGMSKRIAWEGSQLVRHSLALINREVCLQLIDAGYQVSIIPYEKDDISPDADPRFKKIVQRTKKELSGKPDFHVRQMWPPNFEPPRDGHWVMMQPWEFGSLPKEWVHVMRTKVDEIWVNTSFVRQCYIRSGVPGERVVVVPCGVDTSMFNPNSVPLKLKTEKRFKFLFVGGTIVRKGIDILLNAYVGTFSSRDDVCLVIKDMGGKTFYKGMTAQQMIEEYRSKPGAPEIEYIEHMLNERDMAGLYAACDCLVHPYRGEGFGLPIAEAMACGLPVIVTGAGACLDFCDETVAYLIPASIRPFPEKRIGNWETVDFPYFYEPDRKATAGSMRHVYEHPDQARIIGSRARKRIEENFTWGHTGKTVLERIRLVGEKPILRFQKETQPFLFLKQGEELFIKGDMAGAEKLFNQVLALEPHSVEALNNLGVIAFQKEDIDRAITYFVQVLKMQPDYFETIENLANCLVSKKEYSRAIQWFQKALELKPNEATLLTSMGNCFIELGKISKVAQL